MHPKIPAIFALSKVENNEATVLFDMLTYILSPLIRDGYKAGIIYTHPYARTLKKNKGI